MSKAIHNIAMVLTQYEYTHILGQMKSQREFCFLKTLNDILLLCSSPFFPHSPIFIYLAQAMHWILNGYYYCIFLFLYPDVLVFHLCAVNPIAALSSCGELNWTGRQGIKTVLWLYRSISKPLQLTEILFSATIIFNEASLLLESWQKTVIYSSPRAMTANWANIKITCNVKSACAYHYTKNPWCAGKEACQAIVFVNEKNSFIPNQSTVSDLIEEVLTKHRA